MSVEHSHERPVLEATGFVYKSSVANAQCNVEISNTSSYSQDIGEFVCIVLRATKQHSVCTKANIKLGVFLFFSCGQCGPKMSIAHHKSKALLPVPFIVIVPLYALQSIFTLDFVQSRVKIPEFGAVSEHRPVGSP